MTFVELDGSALKSSVAFTGRLACMSRAEAFEVIRSHGGTPSLSITKRTKLLIVGELGWPLLDDGRPSNKLSRAKDYGIPAVSERRFLEWIGKAVPDGVQKTYSAEQIAALSKMSPGLVRELAQLGLLDERDGHFGFRDLASARQIAKLLNDGVRLSEIIRAVAVIRKWLPDVGLANVRLHAGALSDVQVEQHGGRTDKYGQFVFAVDEARVDPDELFDQAQSAEQVGDAAEAERLYRILMKSDPTDASAPFNLGNMLRVCARTVEAEAALRAATRANPAFAEAWYNLATYWTIKVVPKPLSNACARRSRSPPTSPMRCLTWHYCCNERAPTPKLPDYTIRTDLDAVTNARTVCDARHRINRHILPDPTDLLLDYRRCASCGRPSAA